MKFTLFLALTVASSLAFADIEIDMATCMPKGIVSSMKEKTNPKKFWISQNIELEIAIQKWDIATSTAVCHEQKSTAEQERCFEYKRNLYESAVKCYQTTSQLCRANGGNC